MTFFVYGDGKLLAKSRPLSFGQPPQDLGVEVSGVKLLELVARTPGHSRQPDPVTWGDAALHR